MWSSEGTALASEALALSYTSTWLPIIKNDQERLQPQ